MRRGVRRDLENELKYSRDKAIRNQLIRGLLDRVQFELPESSVAHDQSGCRLSDSVETGVHADLDQIHVSGSLTMAR